MTTPIIIETPAPPTRERLVLVPPSCVTEEYESQAGPRLGITGGVARDATPADLERGGWVPLAAFVGPLDLLSPPTLAGALEAIHSVREAVATAYDREADELRERLETAETELSAETIRADEWKAAAIKAEADLGASENGRAETDELLAAETARAETAEAARDALRDQIAAAGCEAAHAGERTYECDVARPCGLCRLRTRAEKAERERDEALLRAHTGVVHYEILRQSGEEAARQRDEARAEVARLTAPGEGEPTVSWFYDTYCARFESTQQEDCADAYRLGVAHERARHVEKDRATDEELVDLYRKVYETHGGLTIDVSHGDCRRAAVRAVAARVRQERCLVAEAVGMGVDVHVTEFVPTQWRVVVVDREATSKTAPCSAADVPATLARLLGEVSR